MISKPQHIHITVQIIPCIDLDEQCPKGIYKHCLFSLFKKLVFNVEHSQVQRLCHTHLWTKLFLSDQCLKVNFWHHWWLTFQWASNAGFTTRESIRVHKHWYIMSLRFYSCKFHNLKTWKYSPYHWRKFCKLCTKL